MADENKNSSAADSILAETADLYEEDIQAVVEETPVEEVVEEAKEAKVESKPKKTSKKSTKKTEKADKADKVESEPAPKANELAVIEEKVEDIAPVVKEDSPVEAEPEEEAPAVPAKSEAIAAIEAKEAAKLQRKNEREQKQAAKRNAKRARLQALIDQCPNEYKPVSVSKFFWYGVLCNLPWIGIIFTILFSIFPINKNVKNFARSILILYAIGLIVSLICMIILFFLTPLETKNEILGGFTKIREAIG